MISGSNEQLQQQLEYTLLKPDCHSWWISKMQSDTLEERYAIKFCFKLGKNATETYGMLQTAFGPSCLNRASVFEWHKSTHRKMSGSLWYAPRIRFGLVWFYDISTSVGYLMTNPRYTYILHIWFGWVWFHGISTIFGYLMPNPLYTYLSNIWFGWVRSYGISTVVGYLMPNPLYTYTRIIK